MLHRGVRGLDLDQRDRAYPEIADIAERNQIWLHVDAAYGGPAAVVPEMRHILNGVERAHSVILNPHKWLYVSIDCSVLYTRFPEIFRQASALERNIAGPLKTTTSSTTWNTVCSWAAAFAP